MRAALFILLTAGCSYPELAHAPEERRGPPPALSPLGQLLDPQAEPAPEADAELEARGNELRARAAEIPADPIEPELRQAMEAAGQP